MAHQLPNELTLIATGPLTNLAMGIQRDLQGMKKLKEIVIMGGAVRTEGNITAHSEFNIFSDPLAAKIVFESGLPITLVPLDVTHQVNLTSQHMEEKVRPIQNPFSQFIIEATGYHSTTRQFRNREIIHLHDPLAVGVAIDSNLTRKERLSIHVETQKGDHYGKTSEVKEGPKVEVCLEVASEKFLDLFLSRISKR
jgi:purine nucleosidase